jgi:hypothetical protein
MLFSYITTHCRRPETEELSLVSRVALRHRDLGLLMTRRWTRGKATWWSIC